MNAIDRPGTFRGKLLDHGVSESSGGFPQLVGDIQAFEFYDEDTQAWLNWAEYEQSITAYLVLYTKKNDAWAELQNSKQVKKVFGWDGLTFESLANAKLGETLFLFRVEEDDYNGQKRLKVQWIDTADANPIKQLQKFDTAKLQGLTQKLGGALSAAAPAPVAAKAPPTAAKAPPKGKPGPKPKATAPASVPQASAGSPPAAPVAPAAPAPPLKIAGSPSVPNVTTKDQAWAAVNEMKHKDTTDAKLAEVWIAEAAKIGKAEDQFTPADWQALTTAVQNVTAVF